MIYFLYGDIPLELKYQELMKEIKHDNQGIPVENFDLTSDSIDDVFQALSSNNMFIPLNLIVVKHLEKIKDISKFLKAVGGFNYSQKIVILMYEEILGEFGTAQNEIDKTSLKNAEKIAKLIPARQAQEKKALEFFVEKELGCSHYEVEKFLEIVGNDYFKVKNEIEKVKLFLDGEAFNLEKVFDILTVEKEFSLFKLLENFLYNKKYTTLLDHLEKEKNYMLFLTLLSEEVSVLAKLKNLQKRGIVISNISFNQFKDGTYPNIKELFKKDSYRYINAYALFLKLKHLDSFEFNFLETKLKDILDAEYNFKSGLVEENIGIPMLITSFFSTNSSNL